MSTISLLCGLNAPKDGNGLVDIASQLEARGHSTYVHSWDTPPVTGSNIVICHSYGATTTLNWLKDTNNNLMALFLIDGVHNPWGFFGWNFWTIPSNVRAAVAFYRGAILPPWSSKIKNLDYSINYKNVYVDSGHGDMPKNSIVQSTILDRIKLITEARA